LLHAEVVNARVARDLIVHGCESKTAVKVRHGRVRRTLTTDICTHVGFRRYGPISGDVAAVIRAGSLFCKGVSPHAPWTCKNSNTGR
jgi:hypothetical protein